MRRTPTDDCDPGLGNGAGFCWQRGFACRGCGEPRYPRRLVDRQFTDAACAPRVTVLTAGAWRGSPAASTRRSQTSPTAVSRRQKPDADWMAVMHEGGPARAFDRRMPAFGEALTESGAQIAHPLHPQILHESAWPRGDLNLPRALFTEKAFPENEAVLTTTVARRHGSVGNEFLYERRLGPAASSRSPCRCCCRKRGDSRWQRGLGDVASRSSTCCSTASIPEASSASPEKWCCRPARKVPASAAASRSSSRSSHSARSCRPMDFSSFRPAWSCPADSERAEQGGVLAHGARQDLHRRPLRARVVADGRTARRDATGLEEGTTALGSGAADAGHAQSPATSS